MGDMEEYMANFDTVKFMARMGKLYQRLYRVPRLGEPLVRGINRGIARVNFNSPIVGRKRHHTMEGFKQDFIRLIELMKFPIEIIPESEKPDSFEFYVNACPYGYQRPDQQGVCDAAMDMDRVMFRRMGAELKILESVVHGAPKCRMFMKKR